VIREVGMGEKRDALRILVEIYERKHPLLSPRPDKRIT
jgi:hypothetical protein